MKLIPTMLSSAGMPSTDNPARLTEFPWLEDDLKVIRAEQRANEFEEVALQSFLIDKFERRVADTPKKTFFIFEDSLFTYEFVDQMACKVANLARSWGLVLGNCVAVMMQNEPAFIWTFLGLQKLGVAVSLINYNLRLRPLIHSILVSEPKCLIIGSGDNLLEAVTDVLEELSNLSIYALGQGSSPIPSGVNSLDSLMSTAFSSAVSPLIRQDLTLDHLCTSFFTSGTTGLPKPTLITQRRAIVIGCRTILIDLKEEDVIYTALPLYHSAGGGLGLYGSLCTGATIVLKAKFSASHFWSDCRRHRVTVIQYIGELFRYLLAQPESELDSKHHVKAALGNGLRQDIWQEVDRRFKIPLIGEFFSSTEGTGMLINLSNKPGAVGRLSPLLSTLDGGSKVLVRFDYATALPLRDKNGRCMKVSRADEPGLFLTRVPEILLQNGEFIIYRGDKAASEKKIVKNAFEEGDMFFNFGDVLVTDQDFFVYFQDRIGDTFRWKGENVSTTEVANAITALSFVHDANVYGVKIPGNEGRAGMVAVTLNEGFELGQKELKEFYDHVCEELPSYARPLFVRHLRDAIITGTFKHQKGDLMNDGFDPSKVKDPLYFLDTDLRTYTALTVNDLSKVLSSRL